MQHSPKNKINPLLKKARKKYVAINRARELLDCNPNSILANSYKNTMFCCFNMIVENGKIKSGGYCKNRWCATCAPIRMAVLINKYEGGWKELIDPYFVTLTDKTVKGKALRKTIESRYKVIREIQQKATRKKLKRFDGTRKTEVTIRPNDLYHAHYHYIISGKENAEFIIKEWLKKCPTAKRAAQDMRPVTNKDRFIEMAKYETKSIVDDRNKDGKRERQCPKRLDVVYRALHKKRTFQPFGSMVRYKEEDGGFDESELEAKTETENPAGVYKYDTKSFDWLHIITKEALTKFKPSENIKGLFGYKNFKPISEKWQLRNIQQPYNYTNVVSCASLSREEQEKTPQIYRIDPSLAFGTANSPP